MRIRSGATDTTFNSNPVSAFDDEYDKEDVSFTVDELRQAVVTDTDWTAETILTQMRRGNFKLNPSFQRRDAWNVKRKSLLIESLILGFPVPQLVLAELKDQRGTFLVLDGKQRLLTLQQFAVGSSLDVQSYDGVRGFRLSGLEVLPQLNGKTLADIEEDGSDFELLQSFLNQTVRTVVVRNWPNEDYLHAVFLRLNTGSVQLSPQELRQALHPGEFTAFLDSFAAGSEPLQRALGNSGPDFRMRDVELALRFYAVDFFLEEYRGNLKAFLDRTAEVLNERFQTEKALITTRSEELEQAVSTTVRIFGDDAFRSWSPEKGDYQGRFNRAVFDAMVFYFKNPAVRRASLSKPDEVKAAFKQLAETDQSFVDSISRTTKTRESFVARIGKWGETLQNLLSGESLTIPEIDEGRIIVRRNI